MVEILFLFQYWKAFRIVFIILSINEAEQHFHTKLSNAIQIGIVCRTEIKMIENVVPFHLLKVDWKMIKSITMIFSVRKKF